MSPRARIRHARTRRARARGRRHATPAGFTLVEVVIAVALLGGVLLGFAAFTRTFVQASNGAALRSTATDIAVEQVESAKAQGSYPAISLLAGNATVLRENVAFARRTLVVRDSTSKWDYRTVTVTVTHPALPAPVRKTTVIAAF